MRHNSFQMSLPLIPVGGKVLDVGGGPDPFRLATHILDPYIDESPEGLLQRGGKAFVSPPGVTIAHGVGEEIPFPDGHFDFVFCSETLNHCQDPVKVVQEMARVGKAGYIDVPAAIHELFEPHDAHPWRCFELGATALGFSPRTPNHPLTLLENFVGYLTWADDDTLIRQDYWKREANSSDQFYIQFVWTDPTALEARYVDMSEVIPPIEERWEGGIGEYLFGGGKGGE